MQRIAMLEQIWKGGRTHAMLLTGAWVIDKAAIAESFAAQLYGVDTAALARMPHLVRLARPLDEKTGERKKQIPLAMVEELQSNLALMHSGTLPKIVLIEDADTLNDQAQNALLKHVEEPRPNTLFLLLAHEPSRLLPTLRSRMVEVRLTPSEEETGVVIASLQGEAAQFLAAPRAARLVTAVQMTKGDDAQASDALLRFLEVLAHTIHVTLAEKYATMSSEQRAAHAHALSLCASAPQVLRENASATLLLESIALALP